MLFSEQELIEQLDREKFLFGEILALSERQLLLFREVDLMDDELVEAFEALLGERKTRMDLIDGIQAKIKETAADPHYRELLNGHRQEIEAIITSIQRIDQQVVQLAKKNLGVFGKKLQEARVSKKALKAYNGEVDTGGMGWFIDRKK